ncbi:hypothetical protein KQI42_04195 [Tissierella sp. MSJ-40]|uniref:Uncharacterized protein n=1 Tax=Tissierella simiarum TaxID=2841534 RepID=A0ABS6E3P8_9FIRM|nr:hypothetical protein [Tissierella simiarum]MBU5437196.1 hypothetical protein [Tissierella simiarum]
MGNIVKKITAILLIMIISFMCNPKITMADDDIVVTPCASDYILLTSVNAEAGAKGKIEISTEIKGTKTLKKVGLEYVKIQKYENGRWNTVKTLSSDMYKYNSATFHSIHTYGGEVGEEYRALVKFYAGDDKGSDTKIVFSNSVTAKK